MSIQVSLHHATRYQYDRPIGLGPQVVRLRPAPHCRTRVLSYSLKVTPAQHFVNWLQDPNGNWLARFVFPEKTREFEVTVEAVRYRVPATVVKTPFFNPPRKTGPITPQP